MVITEKEEVKTRPNLSLTALLSFIASFAIARIFTSFYPETSVRLRGYHIHHFWFGVALLAIGGWLGISYENERVNRIAAILFGAGGGLIGDEVGLLITFENYWTDITYTFVIIFLTLASILIIVARYWQSISTEFTEFLRSSISLYIGVFLFAVSVAFTLQTRNPDIITGSSVAAVVGLVMIVAYFVQRVIIRTRRQKKRE
jgi:hypothetical protein